MALPDSILIVGGGVFGLSTALSLSERHPNKNITLIEASPTIPNPHGASVDTSRIIRADYANPAYAKLADAGIKKWRSTEWGKDGRYTQNGLILFYTGANSSSEIYTRKSYENVKKLLVEEGESKVEDKVVYLSNNEDVKKVVPQQSAGLSLSGGYLNRGSGWGDAEAGVRFAKQKLDEMGKVTVKHGEVERLVFSGQDNQSKVTGVILKDSQTGVPTTITADLVILATGASTGKLIDLRDIVEATGQVLAYINITDEEQQQLAHMPTILSFSTGMFIIPPRNNVLKIARHAYGYLNPQDVSLPSAATRSSQSDPAAAVQTMKISVPAYDLSIPAEGEEACRQALREILPAFAERPFIRTRICWYSDTPTGDFLITYHPTHPNLFLATGGSGHGYKFFPVLGDQIVDALEGKLDAELQQLWKWPEQHEIVQVQAEGGGAAYVVTEDGSRSGKIGMILDEELAKSGHS